MKDKNNIAKAIILILFIGGCIYLYLLKERRNRSLEEKPAFTIGEIIDFEYGGKVAPWFTYEFYIEDKKVKGKYPVDDTLRMKSSSYLRETYIGKKYLIKFSVGSPKFNELYLNKPVPNNLWNCVRCIWKEIPKWAKQNPKKKKDEAIERIGN